MIQAASDVASKFTTDISRAFRMYRRRPMFTIAALLVLSIGMGTNVAIFSAINGVFLKPLPHIREPGQLVELSVRGMSQSSDLSFASFRAVQAKKRFVTHTAAFASNPVSIGTGESAIARLGVAVSEDYFRVLGVSAATGRVFAADEASYPRIANVAVVSSRLWRDQLGGQADLAGKTIRVNGTVLQVVGVLPEGFRGTTVGLFVDVYIPLGVAIAGFPTKAAFETPVAGELQAIARLEDNVSAKAVAEALTIAARTALASDSAATTANYRVNVESYSPIPADIRTGVTGLLSALLVISALLFLMTCANVSGMLLARVAERRTELSIRIALGAGRGRIVSQLLVESVVLFVSAGLLSIVLSSFILPALFLLQPPLPAGMSVQLDTSVDWRTIVYACLAAAAGGVLFSFVPALRTAMRDVGLSLREATGTATRSQRRLRVWLVGGQMTASVLLLITAAMLAKSLVTSKSINPGWVADHVFVTTLDMESTGSDEAAGAALYDAVERRLRSLPGVKSVAFAAKLPFTGQSRLGPVNIEGRTPEPGTDGFNANFNRISSDYFRTLQVPLLQGRDVSESDVADSRKVAVINQAMASRFWPAGDAVGKTFWIGKIGDGMQFEVIGVAANTKYRRLVETPPNYYFIPYRQRYNSQLTLHVKLDASANTATLSAVRTAILETAPALPVAALQPLNEMLSVFFLPQRLAAWIAGFVGAIGGLIGLTGVYGMAALSVTQRRRELSVRLAIGATPQNVVVMLVRQELRPVMTGLLVGFLMAIGAMQLLRSILGTISPLDPAVYLSVASGALVATCIALWVPAARVAQLQPSAALRE